MFFSTLAEVVEVYSSPNRGLITHLQHLVQREEEVDEDPGRSSTDRSTRTE